MKQVIKTLQTVCLIALSVLLVQCSSPKKEMAGVHLKSVMLMGKKGMEKHVYTDSLHPFQNSYLPVPEGYTGTTFELKHDYPAQVPAHGVFPWRVVTNNGLITQKNSLAYVEALKAYVSPDMRKLLYHYDEWDSKKEPWWQSIWIGSKREPIHGMYVGGEFNAGTLTDQNINLTTFVYTLYNETAAVTLNKIWGTDQAGAESPNLSNADDAQYADGSVIIKFAFQTASGEEWSPMTGAATWDIYTNVDPATGNADAPDTIMRKVYLMQFDIIVKDSVAAPKTGWVFSTLVYDKDAMGEDAWDKMVPLGATWGNNPEIIDTSSTAINAPVTVNTALTENWINMSTPDYARSTLGWDGRISGPNDGAVADSAQTVSGKIYPALATAGCLGCHSSAQYTQKSFLLPAKLVGNNPPIYFNPGSTEWMKWFQDRDGKTPMDAGPNQIGLDYDMVTSFKAIPLWQKAMEDKATAMMD